MNLRRANALFKKELIQVMRDPRSLGLAIAIPVLLLILFGFALTLDVDNVPMAVWDQDKSKNARDFIRDFDYSKYFMITGYYDNYGDIEELINDNKILVAMVIPKDFSKLIQSSNPAPVQFLIDGSDSNTATITRGYIYSIISGYNERSLRNVLPQEGGINPVPIEYRPRTWFNPNRESTNFIVPGLIAVIIMIISALLTSLTVAREWERGTMEQLISTPVKPSELILGKLMPYFVIGFVDLIIAVVMAQFVFSVPFRGNLALLFGVSGLFLVGALTLGMLISIITKSQLLASQTAIMGTFLPTFMLSGFMYAIFNMPKAVRAVTYFVPARYFIIILRGIYLKGVGIRVLFPQIAFLLLFTVIVVFLANKKFRKKVA